MKNVSLKLEQTKKSKNGNSLVTLNTKAFEFEDSAKATEICISFIKAINSSLIDAYDMGARGVKIGTVNFSFNAKFTLYVSIDGADYSLDDINSVWANAESMQNSFKNPSALYVAIYKIIRSANGESTLLDAEATKTSTKLLIK